METANGISGRLVLVSNHHACVPLLPLIMSLCSEAVRHRHWSTTLAGRQSQVVRPSAALRYKVGPSTHWQVGFPIPVADQDGKQLATYLRPSPM
jgi:hypothetical protein